MERDWIPVFQSTDAFQVDVLKALLTENGIDCVIYNQQDSMYISVNSMKVVQLMVRADDGLKAKHLIEEGQGE